MVPSYATSVQKLDAAISHGSNVAARQDGNTLVPLEIISLHQERARLTGDYNDYAQAEALLAAQTNVAKPSGALCLASARLHYTLHRLPQASAALDACPSNAEATEVAALRGDIAMYSGRYREAEGIYRNLVNQTGITPHYIRLALLKNRTGAPAEAAALLEAAEKRYHGGSPVMLAWLKLQRGLIALDRGRLDEALAMYRLGTDQLGGWWLLDEHIAETLLLNGKTADAKLLYQSVIARTQSPEFMDALANMDRDAGNTDTANKLHLQARTIYEQRLTQFPEAAAGHALDHFLRDANEVPRALALAQKNFATRPFGEAAIALAKAWIHAGQPARAATLLETQLTAGWDTAETYWVLAEARQMTGKTALAAQAKTEALNRNPRSEKMYSFALG